MAVAYLNVNLGGGGGKGTTMKLDVEGDGTFRSKSDMRPPKTPGPNGLPVFREASAPTSTMYTPVRGQKAEEGVTGAPKSGRRNYTSIKQFSHRVELYRGSVSTVYKALDSSMMTPVVIKSYHKKKMAKKHYHKLEREVRAMMLMRGPYVAELYSCFADDDNIYLIMEFCEGGDLFKHLLMRGGKLDEHYVCVEVIAPLLRSLEKCHALRMMHRDIKPENIFLSKDGQLRLGDFGLALNFETELPFSRSGTLDYMAPEVLKNPASQLQESTSVDLSHLSAKGIKPYTTKVDIWAVGVLAYELVCGKPPFEVEDESQTASLIMYSENIKLPSSCSAQWCDFVRSALTKDPKKRPDASALMEHPWVQSNLQKYLSRRKDIGHKAKEELLMALPLKPPSRAQKSLFQEVGGDSTSKPSSNAITNAAPASHALPAAIVQSAPVPSVSHMERSMSSGINYEVHVSQGKTMNSCPPTPKEPVEVRAPAPRSELSSMLQKATITDQTIQPLPLQQQQQQHSHMKPHPPACSAPVSPIDAEKTRTSAVAKAALHSVLSDPIATLASASAQHRAPQTEAHASAKVARLPTSPKPKQPPQAATAGLSTMSPTKILLQLGHRTCGEELVPPSPGPVGPGIKARMMFHLRQQQSTSQK